MPVPDTASDLAPGLTYVSDALPGLRRQRRGKGFRYVDPRGRTVREGHGDERQPREATRGPAREGFEGDVGTPQPNAPPRAPTVEKRLSHEMRHKCEIDPCAASAW